MISHKSLSPKLLTMRCPCDARAIAWWPHGELLARKAQNHRIRHVLVSSGTQFRRKTNKRLRRFANGDVCNPDNRIRHVPVSSGTQLRTDITTHRYYKRLRRFANGDVCNPETNGDVCNPDNRIRHVLVSSETQLRRKKVERPP